MATAQKPVLSEKKFHNWIKNGVAIVLTKEGLQNIVVNEITNFQNNLYHDKTARRKSLTRCISCSTENVVKCSSRNKICIFQKRKCLSIHKLCPSGVCQDVRDKIENEHRYSRPSWRNTDAHQWSAKPWEIAKCFMPPEGYNLKQSATETDFNGIINVIINCKIFDGKVHADLSNNSNIFCKARDIGKTFRHKHGFELSNKELQESLDVLTRVLADFIQSDLSIQSAIQSIQELSTDSWTIVDKDISKHLQDAIDEAKESIDKSKQKLLHEAKKFLETTKQKDMNKVLGKLQQMFSKQKSEIEKAVRRGVKRIRRESETALDKLDKKQKQDKEDSHDCYALQKEELRNRLIQTYESQCSNLPISSLLEEEKLPLLTFYVKPYMQRLEHHKNQKGEIPIDSYDDIFHKDGRQCKSIYVTGDAGIGKTAFCQRIALLWCLAKVHTMLNTEDESIKEDAEIIGHFDFLFYISLRDTSFCHIEDIIQHQLMGTLDKKEVLLDILKREKCLIILDGLDEWTHPRETRDCPLNIKIPHRLALENCVHLTTSRPYKLEQLRLGTQEIDQQIEILAMREGVGFTFVELLIERLNEKYSCSKDPFVFIDDVAESKLEDLLDVPLITIHLICLWYDGKLTQMSLSRVYANTLEMMFQRTLQRECRNETRKCPTLVDEPEIEVPKFLFGLANVGKNVSLLYRLGHLAFEYLFIDTASNLIFKNSDLEKYGLTEDVVSYLCSVGILSKTKAIGFLTERKHTLSFPHKLYQEFMAALYISLSENKYDEIRNTITRACKTLQDITQFSHVFIFLASMTPVAIEALFRAMNVFLSKEVCDYRDFSCSVMFNFISQRRKQVEYDVKTVQDLAEKCFDECKRAGLEDIKIKLEDLFIYKNNAQKVWKMLKTNTGSIKSMFAAGIHKVEIEPMMSGLVRLEIRYIRSSAEFQQYNELMEASRHTLKNISISYSSQISDIPFEKLENLTSFYLHNVKVKHHHLVKLVEFISRKHDLSQIGLDGVECEDDVYTCMLGQLDLRNHGKLYLLGIGGINFEKVLVNKKELYRLRLDYKETHMSARWSKPLLCDLMCAPVLKKLVVSNIKDQGTLFELFKMISTLQKLKYLYILNIDFGDHELRLDPEGEDVEIEMSHVTLSNESFQKFIKSVVNSLKMVSVNLLFHTIKGADKDVLSHVQSKQILHVLRKTDYSLKFIKNRQKTELPVTILYSRKV